jgi:hypothetical protein
LFEELRRKFYDFIDLFFNEVNRGGGIPVHVFDSEQLKALTEFYSESLEKHTGTPHEKLATSAMAMIIILRITEMTQEKNPSETILETLYNELEASIQNTPRTNRAWAYLHQFNSDMDEIHLDGPLIIRRSTLYERALFQHRSESYGGVSKGRFVIETKPEIEISANQIDPEKMGMRINDRIIQTNPEIENEFNDVVTSFKLIKPSSVGITQIHFEFSPISYSQFVTGFTFTPSPELFPAVFNSYIEDICYFSDEDIVYLNRLLQRYRTVLRRKEKKRIGRLQRSIRRYNNAIVSDEPEDMIVDVVIGLESLFKTSGFRMVFYASNLLGFSDTEIRQAVETLERAYDIRSKVAHGGSIANKDRKVILETLHMMSRILISALVLFGSKDLVEIVKDAAYNRKTKASINKKLKKWFLLSQRGDD